MSGRKTRLTTAKVVKQGTEWYIVGFECGDLGPYSDHDTAHDDAVGVQNFYKHYNKSGFITSEDPRLRNSSD